MPQARAGNLRQRRQGKISRRVFQPFWQDRDRRKFVPGIHPQLYDELARQYRSFMGKFVYIVTVEKPFSEAELPRVKEEICKLLDCTGIEVSRGTHFTVHSRIPLDQMDGNVTELSRKYRAQLRAGGKVE